MLERVSLAIALAEKKEPCIIHDELDNAATMSQLLHLIPLAKV